MAWIESHQQLGRHPKLLRLAGELRIHRAQALGHLQYLWWWALDYAPTGDLSALASTDISTASEWPGDADKFLAALRACGWIDQDGTIHDWMAYAGRILASRESKRERDRMYQDKRRQRVVNDSQAIRRPTQHNTTQHNPTGFVGGLKRSLQNVVAVNGGGVGEGKCNINEVSQTPQKNKNQVVDQMVEFTGDENWRPFFQKAVRSLGGGLCEEAIGEVKMREASGSVDHRGKYLVALLGDWMSGRGAEPCVMAMDKKKGVK